MKKLAASASLLASVLTSPLVFANDCPTQFGCPHCRSCDKTCVMKVEQVDAEEDCYEVECEEVCIPAVRFPWESCRTPKCGRVRRVARLKEESREAKTCKYEWLIVCRRCGRCIGPAAATDCAAENSDGSKVPPAPAHDLAVPPMPPAAPAAEEAAGRSNPSAATVNARSPRARVTQAGYSGRSRTR